MSGGGAAKLAVAVAAEELDPLLSAEAAGKLIKVTLYELRHMVCSPLSSLCL